ncbi:MAG: UDP-N-acetylmuramyl-tripeptide synthetase [Gudongella sp.]|nr:UDP-N-acetylmuramyl-tripeptide synthetase [Gudongella sp.]
MKILEIIDSLEIVEMKNYDEKIDIRGIAFHSLKVEQDYIYVAIKGYIVDGHSFINDAIKRGAKAVFVEEFVDTQKEICQIKVLNTRKALSIISSNFFGNPSRKIKVIGITATNGKTTTSFLLDQIYNSAGLKTGLIGSVIAKIEDEVIVSSLTTPESLELQELFYKMNLAKLDRAVMEVSSSALELYRVNDVDFDIVSFSNFSREHIDQHGSFENYWQIKSSLIRDAKKESIAVLNIDNEKIRNLINQTQAKVVDYSINTDFGRIQCCDLKLVDGRANFTVKIKENIILPNGKIDKGSFEVKLKIPGYHSVENAMAAIVISLVENISIKTIQQGLRDFGGVERRFEFVYEDNFIIIDDHFANIKNINSTLETLTDMEKNKIIIVYAIRGNRGVTVNRENAEALLAWKDRLGIDSIIATKSIGAVSIKDKVSQEEEAVFKEVLDGSELNYIIYDTLDEAISSALSKVERKDLLLLAGCQGMDHGGRVALDYLYSKDSTLDRKELYKPLLKRVSEIGLEIKE